MHINNLDFKTLYFFSGGFLIILSLWTVKGKDFGREEDELATPPPSTSWGSCDPSWLIWEVALTVGLASWKAKWDLTYICISPVAKGGIWTHGLVFMIFYIYLFLCTMFMEICLPGLVIGLRHLELLRSRKKVWNHENKTTFPCILTLCRRNIYIYQDTQLPSGACFREVCIILSGNFFKPFMNRIWWHWKVTMWFQSGGNCPQLWF